MQTKGMKGIDQMSRFSPYTDLALEAAETLTEGTQTQSGVEVTTRDSDNIQITTVKITDAEGAKAMGKPIGSYITIESPAIRQNDPQTHKAVKAALAQSLAELCRLDRDDSVLIVGLGNRYVTPDSLGPKVISGIMVTRHLKDTLPDELQDSVRPVAAVTPSVMGLTGIESSDIIKGIAEKIKPDLIIAIDALAARKASRINATVQMSDTGVTPGAGVGNTRGALNTETLGIPVIAIGVPTVVDAATLINDSLDAILGSMIRSSGSGTNFYRSLQELRGEDKYHLITDCLDPYTENMFVTPKEVDSVTDTLANIISGGINMALHPDIDLENEALYSQ